MFNSLPRISLVYADSEESAEDEDFIQEKPNCLVSSKYAKKAYSLFPNEKDRQSILESIKEVDEEMELERAKDD
jgi:hypothetical protein